jgi:hypothetical protein
MVGIRRAKGGTATAVLRKKGNSQKKPDARKGNDNGDSYSGKLSNNGTTNKENRSEGSNNTSSGIDSAEGRGLKRGGGLLVKKPIKVIPRMQKVWYGV